MPRITKWNHLLKYCGYELEKYSKYQGECVYVKNHVHTTSTCTITKDSHGKGQSITFVIIAQRSDDLEIQRLINLDVDFLTMQAEKITKAFNQLRDNIITHIWF